MTRLDKISKVFAQFGGSVFNKFDISRGLHAEVIIGIVLLLSTVAFSLSMSVMAEHSAVSESVEAAPVETPEKSASVIAPVAADYDKITSTVQVTAQTKNVPVGTDIDVDILVSDLTGLGIIAWQGDIFYDPAVLLPQPAMAPGGALLPGTLSSQGSLTVNPYQSGRIKMAWFIATPPLEGSGVLVRLKFIVVGNIGSSSPLTWETDPTNGNNVMSFQGGSIPSQNINGQINVVGPSTTPPVGATPFGTPIVGSLDVGDTTRTNRLLRNNVNAGCAIKACPGALGLYPTNSPTPSATATGTPTPVIIVSYPPQINTYRYDVIPFVNTTGAAQNFTFTTTVTGPGGVLPAIYSAAYNPAAAVCPAPVSYRGDSGASASLGAPISFSVNIPAGATYNLVMEGVQPIVSSSPSPPLPPIQAAPAAVPYVVTVTIPDCFGATATNTATPANTATASSTATATFTPTATFTATPTATITNTSTPTATSTFTPSSTATSTFTATATASSTSTPTATSTATFTPTATATNTFTPTATATSTFTPTATFTATFTPSATATSTFTPSATATSTFTPSATATSTFTPSATATSTFTPTASATSTFTATATATSTFTATPTATGTFTATPSATSTFTATATASSTVTATPSATSTFTATATSTLTATATATATAVSTPPSIQFSSPTYQDDESQTAFITILRTGNLTGTNTVTFSTSNGTANGGATCNGPGIVGPDYINVVGQSVTFNPGETSKTVGIPLCGDGIIEPDETVNLTLTGSFLGVPNPAVLTINDTATGFLSPGKIFINQGGAANPYPSTIVVSGIPGVIGSMRLTLYDISANVPDNADFLLVAPNGRSFVIMANAGGNAPQGPVTMNFTDSAGVVVPDNGPLATIDYEPTSFGTVANFPAPAPAGPYNLPGGAVGGTGTQTLGGNFNSIVANGVWSLYVRDDNASPGATIGSIAGGWGLEFLRSTAAGASISGRVTTAEGAGIRNARVVVTGNTLIDPIVVTTGSFGYFAIDGLQAGQTYVVTVNSQRYSFSAPSRIISLVDNIIDADFTADPQ